MGFTLHNVIERDGDYVVSNIILRSLADNISSFILIYRNGNYEEKVLRHYLYVIDGLKGRISQLPSIIEKKRLSQAEFEALSRQVTAAREAYTRAIDVSIENIRNLKLYVGRKTNIEKLIHTGNWKFKSLNGQKSLKWNDLYMLLDFNNNISDFISLLSEFVHGLSTSNLEIDKCVETFEPIYGIGVSLIGKIDAVLSDLYSEDMNVIRPKMITALCDTEIPESYIKSLLDECQKIVG